MKIIDTFHLPKWLDGQFLSTLRLGLNNELYFRSRSPKEGRIALIKIAKNNNEIVYNEIALHHISNDISNVGGVIDYNIDERGYIYVAHSGGGITVVGNDGKHEFGQS